MQKNCESNKQCHVTFFVFIRHIELGSTIIFALYYHHETYFCYPTLFCCFFFNEGYFQCQIQAKTGLGKGTVERISKEVEGDKENHARGHPSELSTCDKKTI